MKKLTIKSKIMNFVAKKGVVTRSEIVKFYVEHIKGKKFHPFFDRNVLTIALAEWDGSKRGYLRHPAGKDKRYLAKINRNEYYVSIGE